MSSSGKKSESRRREPSLWGGGRDPDDDPAPTPRRKKTSTFKSVLRRLTPRGVVRALLKWAVVTGIWACVAAGGFVAWCAYDLPDISEIANFSRRPSMTFVDAQGQTIATYGDLFAGAVALDEMSPYLPQAVLATEDRRFYEHPGVDIIGLARATVANLRARRLVQGGSTITQQLAKNVFLSSDRTLRRKVQELLLALRLERQFSKDQILTIYLNRVYFGAGTYGVEAASQRYFGKPSRELSALEAATIAGLLKAPSRYSPSSNPVLAVARARDVLSNEVEAGYMTREEADAAGRDQLRPAFGRQQARNARYFTDWLSDLVPGYVGSTDRDLVIVTTLDARLQRTAETQVAEALARDGARVHASQGALVLMSPDGAVRALVGGRDYAQSQFDRATDARRQPGSAFKPFVYLAAVEGGMSPDDRVSDGPITIGDWSPRNFERGFSGMITAREALARSINTATVRVAQRAGIDRVIDAAHRMGITSPVRRDFSTALGTSEVSVLELTGAYAPFANGGEAIFPYAIAEIRDAGGALLYQRMGSGLGRAIQRPALVAMTDMMSAVVKEGTGRAAALDRPAAGKTGTSQDFRDAWFVGFTADYVCGVWVGNDDNEAMDRITGGSLPARIWKSVMTEAHRGLPARSLPGERRGGDLLPSFLQGLFSSSSAPEPAPRPAPPTARDYAPSSNRTE